VEILEQQYDFELRFAFIEQKPSKDLSSKISWESVIVARARYKYVSWGSPQQRTRKLLPNNTASILQQTMKVKKRG